MRRLRSSPWPETLRQEPPEVRRTPWQARFQLATITPVAGGGVESFEPDQVDIVRIPGIRGQLRSWWRTLYGAAQLRGTGGAAERAEALFQREAKLWGGVGADADGGGSRPSRVRLQVHVRDPGQVSPAGWHDPGPRGLKVVPRWTVGNQLGYALFPFQRSAEERREHGAHESMPTREVRRDLRFELEVTLRGELPEQAPEPGHVEQVLATLWAWIHFGGLGGRTRRGFGALMLAEPPELDGVDGAAAVAWRRLFRGPGGDPVAWCRELVAHAASTSPRLPRLALCGPSRPRADRAHQELIEHLRVFRQGEDVGRDPGRGHSGPGRRPGESRWPEPHLLRLERARDPAERRRYAHPPSEEAKQAFEDGELAAPRAAFGLPIQVGFKDPEDKRANAHILPGGAADSRRWTSPLILRPLATADGRYAPIAVVLGSGPESVRIEMQDHRVAGPRKVRAAAGARPPISHHLGRAGGDALEAFALWLRQKHRYQLFLGQPAGGARHV